MLGFQRRGKEITSQDLVFAQSSRVPFSFLFSFFGRVQVVYFMNEIGMSMTAAECRVRLTNGFKVRGSGSVLDPFNLSQS